MVTDQVMISRYEQRIKKLEDLLFKSKDVDYIPVTATKDDDGHWYILPKELYEEFKTDLNISVDDDNYQFDRIWGKYRTGGDINNIQLYIKVL